MMRTYEEYLDLIKDFNSTVDNPDICRKLTLPSVYSYYQKTNKTPIDYDIDDFIGMLNEKNIMPSTSYLYTYMTYFKYFNHYLISKGFDIFDYTGDAAFTRNNLLSKISVRDELFTPDSVSELCNTIFVANEMYEALIRTFFEGVAYSLLELFELRHSMIDHATSTIVTPRHTAHISKELIRAYDTIANWDKIPTEHRKTDVATRDIMSPYDSLIPSTAADAKTFTFFCNRRFQKLSSESGRQVTNRILYHDGFINLLINKMGMERFIEFINDKRSLKANHEIVTEAVDEFGYNVSVVRNIKQKIQPRLVACNLL